MNALKNMKPDGYAAAWLDADKAYTLRFYKKDWCVVFLGLKKVWECNGEFAMSHFYKNTTMESML